MIEFLRSMLPPDAECNGFAGAFHRGDDLFVQRLGPELFQPIDRLRHGAAEIH